MSWLTERITHGRAQIIASTVREQSTRWWVSFQIEIGPLRRQRPPDRLPARPDVRC
jgi:hypothetical protein